MAMRPRAKPPRRVIARRLAGQGGPGGPVETAPSNTQLPAITGQAREGSTLTAQAGQWAGSPAPSIARQWLADGAPLSGATGASLALLAAHVGKAIAVRETASNGVGAPVVATSASVGPVLAANHAPTDIALTWRPGFADGVISEATAVGTVLADISGTDPDGDSLTFTLAADPGGKFSVVGAELRLAAALSSAAAGSHSFTLQAADGALTYAEGFGITVTAPPPPPDGAARITKLSAEVVVVQTSAARITKMAVEVVTSLN